MNAEYSSAWSFPRNTRVNDPSGISVLEYLLRSSPSTLRPSRSHTHNMAILVTLAWMLGDVETTLQGRVLQLYEHSFVFFSYGFIHLSFTRKARRTYMMVTVIVKYKFFLLLTLL